MLIEFDMGGKRHKGTCLKRNDKTVKVEVAYQYAVRRWKDGTPSVEVCKGHKVITRHVRKHDVRFLKTS